MKLTSRNDLIGKKITLSLQVFTTIDTREMTGHGIVVACRDRVLDIEKFTLNNMCDYCKEPGRNAIGTGYQHHVIGQTCLSFERTNITLLEIEGIRLPVLFGADLTKWPLHILQLHLLRPMLKISAKDRILLDTLMSSYDNKKLFLETLCAHRNVPVVRPQEDSRKWKYIKQLFTL
jgi:hypothetical protein